MALTYISMNPRSAQHQGQSLQLEKDFLFHSMTICIKLLKNKEAIDMSDLDELHSNLKIIFLITQWRLKRTLHAHDVKTQSCEKRTGRQWQI